MNSACEYIIAFYQINRRIIDTSGRRGYDLLCQVETDDGDWELVRLLECGWNCIEEDEEPNQELIDAAYDEGWLK